VIDVRVGVCTRECCLAGKRAAATWFAIMAMGLVRSVAHLNADFLQFSSDVMNLRQESGRAPIKKTIR
jgi:hypothetical protein